MSDEITAISELKEKCKFYWTINNFSEVYEASQILNYIESPKFKVRIQYDFVTEWQLLFYPKGDGENNNKWMSLTIRYLSDVDAYVAVSVEIKSPIKDRPIPSGYY